MNVYGVVALVWVVLTVALTVFGYRVVRTIQRQDREMIDHTRNLINNTLEG